MKFYSLENVFWTIFFNSSIVRFLPKSEFNSIFNWAWLKYPSLSRGTWHEFEFIKLISNYKKIMTIKIFLTLFLYSIPTLEISSDRGCM